MKERTESDWIHSHRNDDPNFDITKLSVETKLNLKATILATHGLDRLDLYPRVPMDPSSEVLLHQWGQTITRD